MKSFTAESLLRKITPTSQAVHTCMILSVIFKNLHHVHVMPTVLLDNSLCPFKIVYGGAFGQEVGGRGRGFALLSCH